VQGFEPEVQNHLSQDLSLVERTHGRKQRAPVRCRTAACAAQIVDAEHAELRRVDAKAGTHGVGPPALGTGEIAVRRNAAHHRHHGRAARTDQPIGPRAGAASWSP